MKVLYVAGPYRSIRGDWGVEENIRRASAVARQLWKAGYAVICPHANTARMDGPDIPVEAFLNGDLEMIRRCDMVIFLPGWTSSVGSQGEMSFAEEIGKPFYVLRSCLVGLRDLKAIAERIEFAEGISDG